jgi:multiple sugar transport system substrate-binding protein
MEGPERLVANWGAKGLMVDLSDMIDATDKAELNAAALAACYTADGKCYEYPLVMTAHCMAINKTVFEAAGAMQYLDAEKRTWTTENFIKAVDAVYAHTNKTVGAVYCKGQGGDQGTRALVNNLYGGTFTNAAHTEYTWNSDKNVQALQKLYEMKGISYDAGIVGGDEIALFYNGTLNMAFCWNIAQQLNPNSANTGSGKTANGDEILFMGFPTEDGSAPKLQGGIWGFGIFNNGDDAKIEASKTFIKYMCDSAATADAVKAANYFAVRTAAEGTDLSKIWADNDVMNAYNVLMPYLGDYYQVTTGWAEARTQWWNMLQKVGAGEDVSTVVNQFCNAANGK